MRCTSCQRARVDEARWLSEQIVSTVSTTTTTETTTTVESATEWSLVEEWNETTTVQDYETQFVDNTTEFVPISTTTLVETTTDFIPVSTTSAETFTPELVELTTDFVSVSTTTPVEIATTTTTSVEMVSVNDTFVEDPKIAIQEEILRMVNEAIKKSEVGGKEKEVEVEEELLFGSVEKAFNGAKDNFVRSVEQASFGEIITLIFAAGVILFFLDKFIKKCYRRAVISHFWYFNRESFRQLDDGERRKRWFWYWTEAVLEKVWPPMWFQAKDIRKTALATTVSMYDPRWQSTREDMERGETNNENETKPGILKRTRPQTLNIRAEPVGPTPRVLQVRQGQEDQLRR